MTLHNSYGPSSFDNLSPESMLKINLVCDQFELAWSHQQPTELADFLKSLHNQLVTFDESEQLVLASELIALDREYRIKSQLPIVAELYNELFPFLTSSHSIEDANDFPSAEQELQGGQIIGDYRILSRIGSGGMGQVFRAEHLLMKRPVAIKFLSSRTRHDQQAQRRFEREMMSLANLSHPNIVTAFDARKDQNQLYLVTEWIDGIDLSKRVRLHGPLPYEVAIRCCVQACQALQYAHDQGIIHRDVKPSNMLLTSEQTLKLLDLGLAKVLWEANDDGTTTDALTKSTLLLGTASFISPEQARNPLNIDARSDIYSLGCTLYFLLSGHPPYQAAHAVDLLADHLQAPIPKLRDEKPDVPAELSELIEQMMAKLPIDRPSSMSEVELRLHTLGKKSVALQADTSPIAKLPANPKPRADVRKQTGKLQPGQMALGMLLAVFVVIASYVLIDRSLFSSKRFARYPANGLLMNGSDSYAELLNFDRQLSDSAILEVVMTPNAGPLPSNVVAWTGENSLILFMNSDRCWGGALHHNNQTRLQVSTQPLELGREHTLAVQFLDNRLELFQEGRRIESKLAQYSLEPTRAAIFFGGTPFGMFTSDRTNRFFSGIINKVHIGSGSNLKPFESKDRFYANASTIALFDIREGSGELVSDETNSYQAKLFNVEWNRQQ